MEIDKTIFKAYDIRGIYPTQLDEGLYYKIGQAYAKLFGPKTVVVGKDVRLSGPSLLEALVKGLTDHGVSVVDIGVITTDMMYFSVCHGGYDGGLVVTASHNPREYNGLKMVGKGGAPISSDTGIYELRDLVLQGYNNKANEPGAVTKRDVLEEYIQKVLSTVDMKKIKQVKVVANINYGPIGRNLKRLAEILPLEIVWLNEQPDGNFPKGRPDPLIPENRTETQELIKVTHPALGVAWDSDADRCFFFDENGEFLSGYFTTAVLAEYYLKRYGPGTILMDSKLNWAVADIVQVFGGKAVTTRTGHSYYKQKMREENALFGGEVSAHMYFKDFYYLDNGLIPFVVLLEIISVSEAPVSEIYRPLFEKYFAIEETNFKVSDPQAVLAGFKQKYVDAEISELDGVALEYPNWRCSLRTSNTEPLLRLNLEARSAELLKEKTEEVTSFINERK